MIEHFLLSIQAAYRVVFVGGEHLVGNGCDRNDPVTIKSWRQRLRDLEFNHEISIWAMNVWKFQYLQYTPNPFPVVFVDLEVWNYNHMSPGKAFWHCTMSPLAAALCQLFCVQELPERTDEIVVGHGDNWISAVIRDQLLLQRAQSWRIEVLWSLVNFCVVGKCLNKLA